MYYSDKDIKSILSNLDIECSNSRHIFNESEQVQPSSIDLRLDCVFWKNNKVYKSIDLRKSNILSISPRLFWKKTVLGEFEFINLKPGEFILGRTYEVFTMPVECAGKIEGRSSLSRLGLGINICCDFINPGWRGHMPLQIFNYSNHSIKIFPYIPICQLILVKLTSKPDRNYGVNELQSKYMNDDGGPSYWWRDDRIKKLQEIFVKNDFTLEMEEEYFKKLGVNDVDTLDRFSKFASKLKKSELTNRDSIFEKFIKLEGIKKRTEQILKWFIYLVTGALLGFAIQIIFDNDGLKTWKIIVWIITFFLTLASIYLLSFYKKKNWFGEDLKSDSN